MSPVQRCALLGLLALLTVGCTSHTSPGVKTAVGAAGGATAGGLLGSALGGGNPVLTAGSTILGLLGGALVGNLLDRQDQRDARAAQQLARQAATSPTGTVLPWRDAQTGHSGTITSGEWRVLPAGVCREYRLAAYINGHLAEIVGCAMQRADGSWELVQVQ